MTRMQVHEVLAHLPREFAEETPPGPTLLETLTIAGVRPIPIGRLSRFWSLGTLQGKVAAAYTFWWIRGLYRSDEEHERHLNETHLKAAVRLLGTMSYMRGAVMKLGQVLAHFPGVVPDEFVSLLGRLQFQAPPMHFELLREMVRSELGADPEDLFVDFETEAFAAASLGQVHRARLKGSGTPVAVKVQYPGIARAIGADVANMNALVAPMRLGPDGASITDQLDDIHRMLRLEVDYRAEAANLATARTALAGMPDVVVPGVHERFSTSCILTMDLLPGVHLDRFLKQNPTQESRNRFGSLMTRAGMRLCYGSHMLYADLHPGNFLFMPDGRLGLIDFGCCHRYSPEDIAYLEQAERAAAGTRDDIRSALAVGADLTPRQQADTRRMETLEAWFDWINEPVACEGPFDFSDPAYFRRGLEIWGRIMRGRYVRGLPVNIWINKSFLGLRAMLHHLGAHVPLGQILREETSVKR